MYEELAMRLRLAKAVLSRNKDLIALLSDAARCLSWLIAEATESLSRLSAETSQKKTLSDEPL